MIENCKEIYHNFNFDEKDMSKKLQKLLWEHSKILQKTNFLWSFCRQSKFNVASRKKNKKIGKKWYKIKYHYCLYYWSSKKIIANVNKKKCYNFDFGGKMADAGKDPFQYLEKQLNYQKNLET